MKIEGHQTAQNADKVREELKNLVAFVITQNHKSHKRVVWNSILLLLNFASVVFLLWLMTNPL